MEWNKPALNDTHRVLFIGVGHMGNPMANCLLKGGVDVAVADVNEAALAPFAGQGVATGTQPDALPGDVVITSLPTDRHVREAILGEHGALRGHTGERHIVIDMSSSAPSETQRLAAELAKQNVAMLDAPVSGGVPRAKTGELTTMVGGDAAELERYRPLLAHMCKNIRHVGAIGAGDTLKALNNFLSAVSMWASSEALLVGARAGLDPQIMVDIWKTSTGRSHAVEVKIPNAVLPRTFDYGFSVGLMAKDLSIAASLSRELNMPTPMLAATEEHYLFAREALGSSADLTRVMTLLETWAHFELSATPQ
ncbi:NAD(P)-dependent oxidoreductase [bacterium]|nr:MAG: NAD(P)-dependent oxidoreductase [bacterium]